MKKILSILLVAVMLVGVLGACGKSESANNAPAESGNKQESSNTVTTDDTTKTDDSSEPAAESDRPADHVTLKMYFHGSNVTDDSAVLEKVNAYLDEKLNVTLEPIWGTWGDFDTNAVLAINGGDDIDIYFRAGGDKDRDGAPEDRKHLLHVLCALPKLQRHGDWRGAHDLYLLQFLHELYCREGGAGYHT